MTLSTHNTIKLNTGADIPMLGFGTFQADGSNKTYDAVQIALRAGYRLIDTAKAYENEAQVGKAIASSDIPRSEIFVTTKLWNSDQGYESTLKAFQQSLDNLGLSYLDLYLIHWPISTAHTIESWRAMEKLFEDGKCRAIGVSNFKVGHLSGLLKHATVIPAVNQIEFHPFNYQNDVLSYCHETSIHLQAYSPLARGQKFDDQTLRTLAMIYKKSPAQILIRWTLQRGISTVPKSSTPERIYANSKVFDFNINDEDMQILNSLNQGFRAGWYPDNW